MREIYVGMGHDNLDPKRQPSLITGKAEAAEVFEHELDFAELSLNLNKARWGRFAEIGMP